MRPRCQTFAVSLVLLGLGQSVDLSTNQVRLLNLTREWNRSESAKLPRERERERATGWQEEWILTIRIILECDWILSYCLVLFCLEELSGSPAVTAKGINKAEIILFSKLICKNFMKASCFGIFELQLGLCLCLSTIFTPTLTKDFCFCSGSQLAFRYMDTMCVRVFLCGDLLAKGSSINWILSTGGLEKKNKNIRCTIDSWFLGYTRSLNIIVGNLETSSKNKRKERKLMSS